MRAVAGGSKTGCHDNSLGYTGTSPGVTGHPFLPRGGSSTAGAMAILNATVGFGAGGPSGQSLPPGKA
jgi:hypothetical protein